LNDDREEDELGCLFPDKCCMPAEHFKSECLTAEMIEQWNQEGAEADAAYFERLRREGE
jgi:hypothetical protein